MEIVPLLLTNALPNDMVQEIYNKLWRIKSPFNQEFRREMVKDTCAFKYIVHTYLQIYRGSAREGYYIECLENEMFWILNNDLPLKMGISNVLRKHFGTIDNLISANQVTLRLWRLMTYEQQLELYDDTIVMENYWLVNLNRDD